MPLNHLKWLGALRRHNSNLLKADACQLFALKKLESSNTPISLELAEALVWTLRLTVTLPSGAEESDIIVLEDVGAEPTRKKKRGTNLYEELDMKLKKLDEANRTRNAKVQTKNLLKLIKDEIKLFEGSNSRGYHLDTATSTWVQ